MAARALAFALVSLGAAAGAAHADAQKVKLSITAVAASSAPYFIAIDKGYFAQEGLDVEIVNAGGGVAIPALISGSIDFSMSAAVSVGASMRGADLRVIYTMADRPAYQVWSIDPAIKTLADLKGKQVGILSRGDTFEIGMRITLRDAGLPQDFVGYTALGAGTSPRQAALASGSLPAVIMSSADVLPLRGTPAFAKAHVIVDMEKVIRMPYTGIATSERLIASNRELVKHFLRGMLKGVLYMRAYKDGTVTIMKKAEPTADPAEFVADWDDLIPALTPDGTASDELIKKDFAVRAAILNIPPENIPPVDRVYDYGPLREVEAEFAKSDWKPER